MHSFVLWLFFQSTLTPGSWNFPNMSDNVLERGGTMQIIPRFQFFRKMKPWLKIDIGDTWEISTITAKAPAAWCGFLYICRLCGLCGRACTYRSGMQSAVLGWISKVIRRLQEPFWMFPVILRAAVCPLLWHEAAWWHNTHALCAVYCFQPPVCMSLQMDKSGALSMVQPVTWLSELKCLHLYLI